MGHNILKNATLLTIAGIIVRFIGFFYRIFLANTIGAEGLGLFQLVVPVYYLIILTLTSGINIAITRIVAEKEGRKDRFGAIKLTNYTTLLIAFLSVIAAFVAYINIDFLTTQIIKDVRVKSALVFIIPSIPIIATGSVVKGYFYGIGKVIPNALSQIFEQFAKVAFIIVIAMKLPEIGVNNACVIATCGMVIGEIGGILLVIAMYYAQTGKLKKCLKNNGFIKVFNPIKELISITKIALPISINRLIISLMYAIENIMIPAKLILAGLEKHQAVSCYGRMTGMAMPLLFFPSVISGSIAISLVPAISKAISDKNNRKANISISKAIKFSLALGMFFAIFYYTCADYICMIVYPKQGAESILKLLSLCCVFLYLQQTLTGVLNGLGLQNKVLFNTIIGFSIRILSVVVFIPQYGLNGYVWGLTIGLTITCILDLIHVTKFSGLVINIREWFIKPLFICIITGVALSMIDRMIQKYFIENFFLSGIIICIYFLIILLVMSQTEIFSVQEIKKRMLATISETNLKK